MVGHAVAASQPRGAAASLQIPSTCHDGINVVAAAAGSASITAGPPAVLPALMHL